MEQIELVIRVSENAFNHYLECSEDSRDEAEIGFAVRHGTILPKRHGRIGDFDKLEMHIQGEWMNNEISNGEWIQFREWLRDEPTIIEADKEGADNGIS